MTNAATSQDANQRTYVFEYGTVRDQRDTLDLRYAVMRGPVEPRRFLVFLNGRTEWIEKYAYLVRDLGLPDDCAFLTMDHRGQGASGGVRAYVDSYESFAADARVVVETVCGDKPYAMVSHSMGGLISLFSVLEGYLRPQSLVLSSPLFGLPNAPLPRVVSKSAARVLTSLHLGTLSSGVGAVGERPFAGNIYTHHAARYAAMLATPYPVGGVTFGWVAATFAAIEAVFEPKKIAKLTVPTLVMGGTDERVVEYESFQRWVYVASQHTQAPLQLRLIPDARHELFSETPEFYDPALAATRQWLKNFLS